MASWRRDTRVVPERLARFVLSEWPGDCPHDSLRQWQRACLAWLAVAPEQRALPFGEYGDCVDVLREVGSLRRSLPFCPAGKCPARNP